MSKLRNPQKNFRNPQKTRPSLSPRSPEILSKSLREPCFLRSRCGRGRKAFRTKTLSKNQVFSHSCGRPVGFTCTYGYSLPPGAKTKFGFSVKPNVTRDKIFKCILKQSEVRESTQRNFEILKFGLQMDLVWLRRRAVSLCFGGATAVFARKAYEPFRSASGGRRALVSFSTKFRGSGVRESIYIYILTNLSGFSRCLVKIWSYIQLFTRNPNLRSNNAKFQSQEGKLRKTKVKSNLSIFYFLNI